MLKIQQPSSQKTDMNRGRKCALHIRQLLLQSKCAVGERKYLLDINYYFIQKQNQHITVDITTWKALKSYSEQV